MNTLTNTSETEPDNVPSGTESMGPKYRAFRLDMLIPFYQFVHNSVINEFHRFNFAVSCNLAVHSVKRLNALGSRAGWRFHSLPGPPAADFFLIGFYLLARCLSSTCHAPLVG